MKTSAKIVGRTEIVNDQRVVLDHASVKGNDYSNRSFVQFCTIGSRLQQCRFVNTRIDSAVQFGSGSEPSEFIECCFDGAHLWGGGKFSRFVRCSFLGAHLRDWFCFETEFVGCVFSGRIQGSVFNGTVRPEHRQRLKRDRNEFQDNDFSSADLIDVAFRTGIDLTRQRLPSGPDYLYLPDAASALERARCGLIKWDEPDPEIRRVAGAMLDGIENDIRNGQLQILLRADGYVALRSEAVNSVFELLRAAH